MTTKDRVAVSMTSALAVDLMMRKDHVVVSTMTVRVVATAALTIVPIAVSMTKRNPVVAARAMSARKTRCTTARKPLAKSA
jgi:hypothetical protein